MFIAALNDFDFVLRTEFGKLLRFFHKVSDCSRYARRPNAYGACTREGRIEGTKIKRFKHAISDVLKVWIKHLDGHSFGI
ncbi:MAG: hypothetical protein EB091_12725 [Betaproteobacteria bacterium]|nr:hypothetical protein [Betaproteobacteria bacterium]